MTPQELIELRAEEPARELAFEVADDLPTLWCRPDALRQVLRELLRNAIHFDIRDAVQVEIGGADAETPLAALYVRDRGPGIPRGEHGRIFDMFYRGHGPGRRGPGLGLALVRRLCEAMGGHVRVDSKVGAGSTFYVALPVDARRDR
ncbi:MAG: ATP-binding protein [Acidobacteriota bacterium]